MAQIGRNGDSWTMGSWAHYFFDPAPGEKSRREIPRRWPIFLAPERTVRQCGKMGMSTNDWDWPTNLALGMLEKPGNSWLLFVWLLISYGSWASKTPSILGCHVHPWPNGWWNVHCDPWLVCSYHQNSLQPGVCSRGSSWTHVYIYIYTCPW